MDNNIKDRAWFTRFFWNFFFIICVLQILDIATTAYLIGKIGVHVENNPIVRFILRLENGMMLLLLAKAVIMALYATFALLWLKHPIKFYKKSYRLSFQLLPIIIVVFYCIIVGLNLLGVIYLRWFL